MILNLNKTKALVVAELGLWALPMLTTWSCLGFLSVLVPSSTSLAWSLTASSPSKTMCVVFFRCLSENWYFEDGETHICGHLCATSLLLCICFPNPWVLFSGVGLNCWMSPSASWAPGVFGGQALSRSQFLVIVSSTSCCWLTMLYKVNSNSNHGLFTELPSACGRVRPSRAAAVAHPLEFEVSRRRTSQFANCLMPAQVRLWNDTRMTRNAG